MRILQWKTILNNYALLIVLLRQSKWNTFLILLVGLGFKLSIQLLCASLDARLAILLF